MVAHGFDPRGRARRNPAPHEREIKMDTTAAIEILNEAAKAGDPQARSMIGALLRPFDVLYTKIESIFSLEELFAASTPDRVILEGRWSSSGKGQVRVGKWDRDTADIFGWAGTPQWSRWSAEWSLSYAGTTFQRTLPQGIVSFPKTDRLRRIDAAYLRYKAACAARYKLLLEAGASEVCSGPAVSHVFRGAHWRANAWEGVPVSSYEIEDRILDFDKMWKEFAGDPSSWAATKIAPALSGALAKIGGECHLEGEFDNHADWHYTCCPIQWLAITQGSMVWEASERLRCEALAAYGDLVAASEMSRYTRAHTTTHDVHSPEDCQGLEYDFVARVGNDFRTSCTHHYAS